MFFGSVPTKEICAAMATNQKNLPTLPKGQKTPSFFWDCHSEFSGWGDSLCLDTHNSTSLFQITEQLQI